MSKLIVETEELRNDAKKFTDWAGQLTDLWNKMESEVAPHTDESYFGMVPKIKRFYGDYNRALDALRQYLVGGGEGSAVYAFTHFSDKLTKDAADVYDGAVEEVRSALSQLPQS